MKFTKEQFSEALKAKLTTNGKKLAMSERTFKSNVERIYKRLEKVNDEELEINAAIDDYLPDFEDIEGNMRKDNADFIKKWNEEHHVDPKPTGPKPKVDGEETEIEKLQKQVQALVDREKANTTARTIAEKKSAILSKLKDEKVTDDKWLNGQLEIIAIDEDTDVESVSQKLLDIYNINHSKTDPSITPGSAGGGDPANKEDFSDVVAIMKRSRGEFS